MGVLNRAVFDQDQGHIPLPSVTMAPANKDWRTSPLVLSPKAMAFLLMMGMPLVVFLFCIV